MENIVIADGDMVMRIDLDEEGWCIIRCDDGETKGEENQQS